MTRFSWEKCAPWLRFKKITFVNYVKSAFFSISFFCYGIHRNIIIQVMAEEIYRRDGEENHKLWINYSWESTKLASFSRYFTTIEAVAFDCNLITISSLKCLSLYFQFFRWWCRRWYSEQFIFIIYTLMDFFCVIDVKLGAQSKSLQILFN